LTDFISISYIVSKSTNGVVIPAFPGGVDKIIFLCGHSAKNA